MHIFMGSNFSIIYTTQSIIFAFSFNYIYSNANDYFLSSVLEFLKQ